MSRSYLSLTATKLAVLQVASRIYAARLAAHIVPEGEERTWLDQSVEEAVQMARIVDEAFVSENETG